MTKCLNCGHESDAPFKFCPSCGMEVRARAAGDALVGQLLNNKYRVLDLVGAGAMGKVYRAEHTSLKKTVAIKVLHDDLTPNDETIQRFQGEGIAAGRFTHPNAIQIFDFDRDERANWFLAMEFVEGSSLKEFLADKGALATGTAVDLMIQVLDALAEAHRQGIIHRDLKPDNIMVVESPSGALSVKVLDFGLSKLVDTADSSAMLTQTGRILGTPRYMAPEQWGGQDVDHRIDVYAAGLVLYEMLVGEAPFASTTLQDAMVQSMRNPVPSLSASGADLQVPDGLDEVIGTALARDREDRFASAAAMRQALEGLDFARLVTPGRGRRRARRAAPERRAAPRGSRMVLLVAAAAVLGLAAVSFFLQYGAGRGEVYARVSDIPPGERSEAQRRYVAALEQARSDLRQNDLDGALAAVDGACHMECADSEAFFVRAQVRRAKRDESLAILDFQEAIKHDANYAEAHAGLGWIRFDAGELDDAQILFGKATALDASSASGVVGAASVAWKRGDLKVAAAKLQGVDRSVDSASVLLRIGRLWLALDKPKEAELAFTQAKRANSFDWRVHAGLGEVLLRQGRTGDAADALRESIRLGGDIEPRVALATLYVSQEQWPEAEKVIDAALGLRSTDRQLTLLKGLARQGQGDPAGAIAALGKLETGDDVQVLTLLGILYQGQGDFDAAIRCYRKLQALDASRPEPFVNHGLCLMGQERYEDAFLEVGKAIQADSEYEFAYLTYGVIAMEYLGRNDVARRAFERYQQLGGDDPRVEGWLEKLR